MSNSVLSVNDEVVVHDSAGRYPRINIYRTGSSFTDGGTVEPGEVGTVAGVTSSVVGEDRFVLVKFRDKSGYVSERFLKKVT